MTMTRLTIIERMADSMGLRRTGQITSSCASSATSLIDTDNRYEADDYWNEGFLLTTGSTNSGIERRISDFANGTQAMTLYSAVGAALSTSTTYDVFATPVEPYEYRTAIKAAASKMAAYGISRRALDTTLQTTLSRRYAMPSVIDVSLTEVWMQHEELIPNNLWLEDDTGWTLHANASLTNDGSNGERTLKLVATAGGEASYQEIDVSPMDEFEFFAMLKVDTTGLARWRYQVYDTSATSIVSATVIGSGAVNATSWTIQSGRIVMPANAATLRLMFDGGVADTVYTQAPNLMRYGNWERLSDWKPEYDGETAYFILDGQPPRGRRLKLKGRRTLESLSADSDTLSMDEPEIAAFVELACIEAWSQFGGRLSASEAVIERAIANHEKEFRKYIGRLSGPWRTTRYPNIPTWTRGH